MLSLRVCLAESPQQLSLIVRAGILLLFCPAIILAQTVLCVRVLKAAACNGEA